MAGEKDGGHDQRACVSRAANPAEDLLPEGQGDGLAVDVDATRKGSQGCDQGPY